MFSKRKGDTKFTQNSELELTSIMAILDVVGTGDLSKRISASELGTSTQVQELSKRINMLIESLKNQVSSWHKLP